MQAVTREHDHRLGERKRTDKLTECSQTVTPCGIRLVRPAVDVEHQGLQDPSILLASLTLVLEGSHCVVRIAPSLTYVCDRLCECINVREVAMHHPLISEVGAGIEAC